MEVIISESRLAKVLHKYLVASFDGFDNCVYDWAEYNCGMGVCCDQYAIGFVLPESEYNNYLFKLVNGGLYDDDGDYPEDLKGDLPEPCHNQPNINDRAFDTIVIDEEMYETLNRFAGNIGIWREPLLSIINNVFHTNAHSLFYPYED
jgi:hypothetical protein